MTGILRGMLFGICNEIFEGWDFETTCACAAKIGYDIIEIAPFTLAPYVTEISAAARVRVRETAARAGLAISGLHWVLAKTEGLHLTTADEATRGRTARYLMELVDCCADVGGTRIILGSPKQRNIEAGVTFQQAWAWAAETLRDAVKRAEDRGVIICFEPLGPGETNFVNTAAEGIRFAEHFASPAVSIILDVKAMSTEPKTIVQVIRESAGRFAYFHANDKNLKGPGFGEIDFVPIAAALREVEYDGVVSVEVFDFSEGPEAIASGSLQNLRAAFGA